MEIMGLKALVTGGTGFIGSNLVRELLQREWEVYVLVRKNSSLGYNRLKNFENIRYIYIDELFGEDFNDCDVPQFDVCFHLAAYGVDYNQQNIDQLINGNVKFTMDLLGFCKKNKTKKIVNTGSCAEYGLNEGKKLNEENKLNPQSLYGAAKASNTIMANAFSKENDIPLVTVRPFGIFGPNEGIHKFVPQLMKVIIENKPIEMTYGDQIRDYLYIEDLIDGYIKIALTDVPLYETYNICSGTEVRIKDLALEVSKLNDEDAGLFIFGAIPYRKNEVMHFVGDNSKIKKYTDWKPKYTLQEGLERTYEWYKTNMEDML